MKHTPIEYAQARQAVIEAWKKYNDLLEAGEKELALEMAKSAEWLEERKSAIYAQWQAMGGTSDIESIALRNFREEGCGNDTADLLAWTRF